MYMLGLGGAVANTAATQNTGIHSLPGTNHLFYWEFRLDAKNGGGGWDEERRRHAYCTVITGGTQCSDLICTIIYIMAQSLLVNYHSNGDIAL